MRGPDGWGWVGVPLRIRTQRPAGRRIKNERKKLADHAKVQGIQSAATYPTGSMVGNYRIKYLSDNLPDGAQCPTYKGFFLTIG